MSINNLGGSLGPSISLPDKVEATSPDNYPSYGNKSLPEGDVTEDKVSIRIQLPIEKETGDSRKKDEPESPDNYPSYGNKSAKPGKKREKAAPDSKNLPVIYEEPKGQEGYFLALSPDNYPSYGNK